MKLYVWKSPWSVDYGDTCLYVVAKDLREARRIARKARVSKYGHPYEDGEVDCSDLGEPNRIIEAPCAEVYYWSE